MLVRYNKNKKAQISILLLVFMILVLAGATIGVLLWNDSKIVSEISDANVLDDVYAKEKEIDFYIYDILDSVSAKDESDFINEFKAGFDEYKYDDIYIVEEFDQIVGQIVPENVLIEEDFVAINFTIKIEHKSDDSIIAYLYEKTYKKYY